jgi:uncharacterized protein (DUF2235 family)
MPSRLIACIDGTWNAHVEGEPLASNATHVARICELLINGATPTGHQRVIYRSGVGTSRRDALRGALWGKGSLERIQAAYRFICEQYEPGDELSLFGFSRGAFAVRSVLGVIASAGVLRRTELDHVAAAVALTRPGSDATERSNFTREHSYEVPIRFVGVWDTVVMHGPLTTPVRFVSEHLFRQRFGLFDQTVPTKVQRFCHALALDEQRAAFWPSRAQRDEQNPERVEEVWFAGCHADVGGGCPDPRVSTLALEWMVERAAQEGLVFKELPRASPDACCAPLHPSRVRGWLLLGCRPRIVERGDVLHPSVEQRMRATGYIPAATFIEPRIAATHSREAS